MFVPARQRERRLRKEACQKTRFLYISYTPQIRHTPVYTPLSHHLTPHATTKSLSLDPPCAALARRAPRARLRTPALGSVRSAAQHLLVHHAQRVPRGIHAPFPERLRTRVQKGYASCVRFKFSVLYISPVRFFQVSDLDDPSFQTHTLECHVTRSRTRVNIVFTLVVSTQIESKPLLHNKKPNV